VTIVTDVLFSLAVGLGLAVIITFQPAWMAFRPSESEVRRFERAADTLARSRRLLRDGYLWLTGGLILVGLRSLPGGVIETIGFGVVLFGYFMLVVSIAKLTQWRYPNGPRRH
jgi:hypothetical protein